jgi:MFS family permease
MSDVTPGRKLTLDDLNRALGLDAASSGDLAGYLDAAAVLAAFDPLHLQPAGAAGPATEPDASAPDQLLLHCEPVTQGPGRGLWRLSLPDRRAALRRLGTREKMRRALSVNRGRPEHRPELTVQQAFERVLSGKPVTLAGAAREDLAALLTVLEWVDGILDGLPGKADIGRAIALVDLLAPMRRLADDNFVGRADELGQLIAYVLRDAPGGIVSQLDRTFRSARSAPLFIYGPGGMGKSTLLARFILDQVEGSGRRAVYLDMDRPTIRPDSPATVLLEIASQLRPQLDGGSSRLDSLVQELAFSVGRADPVRVLESTPWYYEQLSQVRATLAPLLDGSLVLVVIDTFEEVDFLGADVAGPFLDFLLDLAKMLPELRLVLSGRTLPDQFVRQAFPGAASELGSAAQDDAQVMAAIPVPYRPVNLGLLDQPKARELLQRLAVQAGLHALPIRDLDDVIGVVSRNPMCLRLAARILASEGTAQLVASRSAFLTRLRAEKIQALLYGRILSHLHADDVRAVAYPGLVVRRLTADVIRDVLAEPCGLELTPERDEHAIFAALSKEVALVQVDPADNSLRHRADVRRAMLEDLTDHVPADVVERIDQAAVRFYLDQPGPVARAEEIYHRLRLREPGVALDDRWLPGARDYLKNAGAEVPAQQRLWLAGKLGVTLGTAERQEASQEAWEDQAARSAARYLQSGEPDLALHVLQERTTRLPRSRLYFLEAEAFRFLRKPDAALRAARAGADATSRAGAVDMTLELLLQMVVIQETRGQLESAAELAAEADETASLSGDAVLRLRAAVTRLRIHRRLRPGDSAEGDRLRRQALACLTDDVLRAIRAQPVLLREAAAELAEDDPQLAATAVATLGVEVGSDEQAAAFGQAIAELSEAPPAAPLDQKFAEGAEKFQNPGYKAGAVRGWAAESLTDRDVRELGSVVGASTPGGGTLRNFRDYFRIGVDSGLTAPRRSNYRLVLCVISLGSLLVGANSMIVIISLPAIFRGIKLDPLTTVNVTYLLWMVLGYALVLAVLAVTVSRLGDCYGRVRIYNLGFALFAVAALALPFDPFTGPAGALWLIGWRVVQATGAAGLLANAGTILANAVPADRRGRALGINQVISVAGTFIGLFLGGGLAVLNWRLVFGVMLPLSLIGAVSSFVSLREISIRTRVPIDWLGNVVFALGLVGLLTGIIYGILPYGGHVMGWTNPVVLAALTGGVVLLAALCFIELRVHDPMFDLRLLKIRAVAARLAVGLLAAMAGGSVEFILIIWLQGIWLILRGYSVPDIPLWSAWYLAPLTAGVLVGSLVPAPLANRSWAHWFTPGGLVVSAAMFGGLLLLPTDFQFAAFGLFTFFAAMGVGLSFGPNTAVIVNSVPARQNRAVTEMLSAVLNCGYPLFTSICFTLLIKGVSGTLPGVMTRSLTAQGVPASVAHQVAQTPAAASLFSTFLGDNPVKELLAPTGVLHQLPPANVATLTSRQFFPDLISGPFHNGLVIVFGSTIAVLVIAAALSLVRDRSSRSSSPASR